jgi:hypothetical protein
MDAAVTFTLDHYEPVALHTYPALMRAAIDRTELLQPAGRVAAPTMPIEPAVSSAEPADVPTAPAEPVAARETPAQPVDAYLVGIAATAVLRQQLADFLDAAGARRDIRVSVGVGSGSAVEWVLRSAVPYRVRALPRYPAAEPVDAAAVVAAAARVVGVDAADQPDRRRLLILVWGGAPAAVRLPDPALRGLVLHCSDAELERLPAEEWGPCWLLSRSRSRPRRSLLAQAGQLLSGWEAFREMPDGLVLTRLG